jgi:hypothetical protein
VQVRLAGLELEAGLEIAVRRDVGVAGGKGRLRLGEGEGGGGDGGEREERATDGVRHVQVLSVDTKAVKGFAFVPTGVPPVE